MRKFNILLTLVCAFLIIAGCTIEEPNVNQNVKPVQPNNTDTAIPETQVTEQAQVKNEVSRETIVVKGSITDCSFLTISEIKEVVGVNIKDGSSFPRTDGCSKSWIDMIAGTDAIIALQVTKQDAAKVKADVGLGATVGYEKVETIGDYDTYWDKISAINFGKGEYKFQVQCAGDSCSKEKAVALAKIVVSKTP